MRDGGNPIPPTVVISFDVEQAWGWGAFDEFDSQAVLECARWTHDYGIPAVLSHLSRNNLTATWAFVGLMMFDRLLPIDDLVEVSYLHCPKPRLQLVPQRATEADAPEWFGASVLQRIREAAPAQEIAFHSFSHVMLAEPATGRERAQQELKRCVAAATRLGFAPDSFVFPWNSIGYLDILRDLGFKCYRSKDRLRYDLFPSSKARAIVGLFADVFGLTPNVVYPSVHDGLVDIPGCLLVRCVAGWRRLIPDASRLRRLRRGLQRVCLEGGVFHVWLHPENLYLGRPRLERVLAQFMDEVRSLVDEGKLRCLNMGQLAHELLAEQDPLHLKQLPKTVAASAASSADAALLHHGQNAGACSGRGLFTQTFHVLNLANVCRVHAVTSRCDLLCTPLASRFPHVSKAFTPTAASASGREVVNDGHRHVPAQKLFG